MKHQGDSRPVVGPVAAGLVDYEPAPITLVDHQKKSKKPHKEKLSISKSAPKQKRIFRESEEPKEFSRSKAVRRKNFHVSLDNDYKKETNEKSVLQLSLAQKLKTDSGLDSAIDTSSSSNQTQNLNYPSNLEMSSFKNRIKKHQEEGFQISKITSKTVATRQLSGPIIGNRSISASNRNNSKSQTNSRSSSAKNSLKKSSRKKSSERQRSKSRDNHKIGEEGSLLRNKSSTRSSIKNVITQFTAKNSLKKSESTDNILGRTGSNDNNNYSNKSILTRSGSSQKINFHNFTVDANNATSNINGPLFRGRSEKNRKSWRKKDLLTNPNHPSLPLSLGQNTKSVKKSQLFQTNSMGIEPLNLQQMDPITSLQLSDLASNHLKYNLRNQHATSLITSNINYCNQFTSIREKIQLNCQNQDQNQNQNHHEYSENQLGDLAKIQYQIGLVNENEQNQDESDLFTPISLTKNLRSHTVGFDKEYSCKNDSDHVHYANNQKSNLREGVL